MQRGESRALGERPVAVVNEFQNLKHGFTVAMADQRNR
jgi:hypothetical protein